MLEAIVATLRIMCWLGIVLGILAVTNITTNTMINVWSGKEKFKIDKMLKGIIKILVFYISSVALSVALTMLPSINEMITLAFGVILLSSDLLNTLSSVGVLGVVVSTIVIQARKAMEGVVGLANISAETEEITWEVIENEE